MYSSEYKCTKLDTKNTTNNIVADSESNKKTHSIFKISTKIHLYGKTIKLLVDISATS